MRILYNSKELQYKTPFGVLAPEEVCCLHIDLPRELQTRFVQVVMEREDGTVYGEYAFAWAGTEGDYDRFKCDFTLAHRGLYFYWFRVTAKTGTFRLFKQDDDTNMEAGDKWQLSVIPRSFTVPEAFQGAVMYQIFPDRFCKVGECDTTGKLEPFKLRSDWGGAPEYKPNNRGEVLCNDFFGGNFRGIASKLDYLASLGVKVVYLNPIGMAFSNHRYDTADYKRPDPLLGTEADFASLCDQAHRRGMKVILDGVYSHTGCNSVYFDRYNVFHNGAYSRGPASPYYCWYNFRHYPDDYECWWNFSTLPNLKELEPSYLRYLIDDDDSVIAHWLSLGADGFRLDVADELPDEFILRFKTRLRALKPDALLLGEVWEDASNKCAYSQRRRYFIDGELDSVMNYPWRNAIIRFARQQDDGTELARSIMTLAENYPPQVLAALMNSLGTHDTGRILTILIDDFEGDRDFQASVRLTLDQRELALQRLKVAAFLQYTLPGSPCLYYGDEAGMEVCKDPFNRGCFPWGEEKKEFLELFRAMGRLKNSNPALRTAQIRILEAGQGRIAFVRTAPDQTVLCCANHSARPWHHHELMGHPVKRILYAQPSTSKLVLPPHSCAAYEL